MIRQVSWLTRYRIRLFVRSSMWLFPALSIPTGLVALKLLLSAETYFGWTTNISLDTARLIMSMVASSMFTLIALVCSAVLVAVQLASAQLTPRIIAIVYRDPFRKMALALFTFTFTFSVGVLARLEASQPMPLLSGYVAAYGFLLNLALLLVFVDGMGKSLRPSSALRTVGLLGRGVVTAVYPHWLDEHSVPPEPVEAFEKGPRRVVLNEDDGALLMFDMKGLLSRARRYNCVIELVPEVGDFVAAGDPLFRIYDGGDRIPDEVLRGSVAIGQERTLEQDPMFAFRIIVDIAAKALSPAVNDPTTAVLAIDQIHHLLRLVGTRYLAEGHVADATGRVRFVHRTPDWEDFVRLAVTEVRQYGRDSIQVMRRLRAMLENLIETLPERRAPALRRELELLGSSVKRTFPDVDDQSLAVESDLQGLGSGSDGRRAPAPPAHALN
jgi:uncharacterized membrane protein